VRSLCGGFVAVEGVSINKEVQIVCPTVPAVLTQEEIMSFSSLPNCSRLRRRVSAVLRALAFSLLMGGSAALHAQSVGYVLGFNGITAFNTATNTVTANIPVDPSQFSLDSQIIASPDGSRVYALYEGNASVPSKILVIDTASNTAVATIPNVGAAPLGLAITPDGAHIYVADQLNAVFVVDTATNTVEASSIALSGNPSSLIVTPNGAQLYVAQEGGRSVSIINTATNAVVGSPIFIGCNPLTKMAVTPDGTQVYVGCAQPGQVVAISTATNTVTATIPLDTVDFRLAVSPDGTQLYVSGLVSGSVGVISTATNTLTSAIPVGSFPTGVGVTPDGAAAYVAVRSNSTVTQIDTATNTIVATGIPVASQPNDLTIFNMTTPFAAFTITNLVVNGNLHEQGAVTLGPNSQGVDLANQPLTLTVNNFSLTIPAGSFRQVGGNLHFVFNGTVDGLPVEFNLKAVNGSSSQFTYVVNVQGVSIGGPDPATVGLKIGENTGTTTAAF
jgi:YVTN family beta-propeller protein